MSKNHAHDKCCDPCEKRMQGEQGPQGVQGPAGPQGLQGVEGKQGIPGSCVNCFHDPIPPVVFKPEFADLYSSVSQTLAPSTGPNLAGDSIKFESLTVATTGIDVSQAATNGKVIIKKAGWYDLVTGACGTLNPVSSPLLCWTVSLFKNDVLISGSTAANMTITPEQKANEIFADVFIHCEAGDVLTMANTSVSAITLNSPTLGTYATPNSAFFKIFLLEEDK